MQVGIGVKLLDTLHWSSSFNFVDFIQYLCNTFMHRTCVSINVIQRLNCSLLPESNLQIIGMGSCNVSVICTFLDVLLIVSWVTLALHRIVWKVCKSCFWTWIYYSFPVSDISTTVYILSECAFVLFVCTHKIMTGV